MSIQEIDLKVKELRELQAMVEEATAQIEATKLLRQMNERQLRKAARFMQLYIGQGMSYEDAVTAVEITEAEFPKE